MENWAELKQELKEQAKQAYGSIKNSSRHYRLYAVIALMASSANMFSQYAQSLNTGDERLQNRLQLNEVRKRMSTSNNDTINKDTIANDTIIAWDSVSNEGAKPQIEASEQKIEKLYNKAKANEADEFVSIKGLMEKVGVKMEDIQAVVNKNPEFMFDIVPGQTGKKLARAANRVTGEAKGACTRGVQAIFARAGMGTLINANNELWPEKFKEARGSNSGCNTYIPLEKSGNFITISIDNLAYSRYGGNNRIQQNQAMREFAQKLPSGTVLSLDNKLDDYSGRRLPKDKAGIIHGHTCVKTNKRGYACDGWQQNGPNFMRYGAKVHASIAVDSNVNKVFALEILKQAAHRQEQEKQLEVKAALKSLQSETR